MRVCDRHPRTRAVGKIIFEIEDERYDLCDACLYEIKEYISNTEKKGVEEKPKKKKGFLNLG